MMCIFFWFRTDRTVSRVFSTEECILQENMATHFCAKMKTTITSTEYSDHDTLNSQNFVDFLMTKALQNYMEDEEYPIVLQAIELTYLGPRWVSFDRLGLSLIGDISGKMNSANQRIFRRAVSAFINDDKQATLLGGATDVAIRHQTISHEGVYPKKNKMNTAPSELLYVEVTLFRTLEESKMTTKQYSDGLISRFESYPDYFVGHHLRTGFNDDFFLNVQTVQVAISEGNAIEIPVSTLSPSTKAPFVYTKPEKPFNLKALAASVAILPLIVLLAACVLIYLLSSRKRRRQRQSTKSSQQEVIIVE